MPYEKIRTDEVGRPQSNQKYAPSAAPKWDVLQREQLTNTDLDLDYRVSPVLSRKDRHYIIFIMGLIGFISLFITAVTSLTSSYIATPFILSLFTTVSILNGLIKFIIQRVKWIAFVSALTGPILWLIAVMPSAIQSYPALGYLFLAISLSLAGFLAGKIANHYAKWLAASPQLIGDARYQVVLKNDGLKLIALYGVLLIIFARDPIVGFKSFIWITLVFALAIFVWATELKQVKKKLILYRDALVSWFTYARYQAIHFDFVESSKVRVGYGCLVFLWAVLIYMGVSLHYIGLSNKSISDGFWATFFASTGFLWVSLITYNVLYAAYDFNGTIHENPVQPPGMFRSPEGSWIRRNLVSAVILYCLFTSTAHFITYAPTILLYGDNKPLVTAFSRVVNDKFSLTWMIVKIKKYEPIPLKEIVNNLSEGEVVLLKKLNSAAQEQYILGKQTGHYLVNYPDGWLSLAVDSVFMGESQGLWAVLLSFLQCLLFPVLIFLAICLSVFGRALPRYAEALNQIKSQITDWQGYVYRLQNSENQLAREHLLLGVHATEDYPILLHRNILGEHCHLLGDSGSGKTALGMAPLLAQLATNDAVVIIDLKGDMALFQTAYAAAGERFKFFTNEIGKATYAFNPISQFSSKHISLNQVCEIFLSALGLDHGEGYGRSYYSRVARSVLSQTISEYPDLASFDELRDKVKKIASSVQDTSDAFELIAVVESLASCSQLNYVGEDAVAKNAINMPEVIKNREVVYFWLPAAIESSTVKEIAKLALYTLFSSAYQHQRDYQETPRLWVFIDEFQHVASLNFKLILQQARSMGMGLILANQTDSDLWTADVDLKGTVQSNTRFKQIFSIGNQKEREELSKASGETLYSTYWDTPDNPSGGTGRLGPRLMLNDIIALSDEKDTSIAIVSRGEGYTQFGGYAFAVRGSYHITAEEYERRKNAPWPVPSEKTLVAYRKARTGVPPPVDLRTAYILSEDEPPPEMSNKTASSPWAQYLESLRSSNLAN